MNLLCLATAALLAQADSTAAPDQPAAPTAAPAPGTVTPADLGAPTGPRMRTPSMEELQRQLDRIRKLPPTEAGEAMQDIFRKLPQANDPAAAPADSHGSHGETFDLNSMKLSTLSEPEQVKYTARTMFNNIISGDARALVLQSAYPFQLEDRRLEMPDELHKEWLKNLRSKRTDLLTLYDIEVLTPAEMEKKYGRPPARLAGLPWRAPRTLIAIGNLSGRAAVAVFRSQGTGSRWQLVGYHD